jgi:hypothetical protein
MSHRSQMKKMKLSVITVKMDSKKKKKSKPIRLFNKMPNLRPLNQIMKKILMRLS